MTNQYPGYAMGLAPILEANAGADQVVNDGDLVTLHGEQTPGSNLTFSWTQVPQDPGPLTVILSDPTSATPTFTAPFLLTGLSSQMLTFQLTVTSGTYHDTDTVNVTITNVNHAPTAMPGGPASVSLGSLVGLVGDGTAPGTLPSYDMDGDPIVGYNWQQTNGPAVVTLQGATSPQATFAALAPGAYTFTLTVSDGQLLSAPAPFTVTVGPNNNPVANAGDAKTVNEGAPVVLQGSASDPDSDPLTYQWTQIGGSPMVVLKDFNTLTPSFTAPVYPAITTFPTDLTFQLTVSDPYGGVAQSAVIVTIVDPNAPPDCRKAKAEPNLLWPPNHKMHEVRIKHVKDPDDEFMIRITSVTQDEPVNGLGDGDTSPDAVIKAGKDRDHDGDAKDWVLLRAERSGKGDGRVYRITFTAIDSWGGTCSNTVTVGVPLDAKRKPVDSGANYDSTQP